MSDEKSVEQTEVANPYEGRVGTRNGVKVPWVQRNVQKGDQKGRPYITLDGGRLSDSDLVTAIGIAKIRELVEASLNVAGRNFCEDNLIDPSLGLADGNFNLDQVQLWADGVVIERVSMKELKDRAMFLFLKFDSLTDGEMQEFMDIRVELSARTRDKK